MCEGLTIDEIRAAQKAFIDDFKSANPVTFNLASVTPLQLTEPPALRYADETVNDEEDDSE